MKRDRWAAEDMPDQTGRVAIVTGANAGLGYATALALAKKHARVVLAVRNEKRGQAAMAQMLAVAPDAQLFLQLIDLSDLGSVRRAATALLTNFPQIDLLINNAGIISDGHRLSPDGLELTMATNYFGAFALTELILPRLLAIAGSRVVMVSSVMHRDARSRDFERFDRPLSGARAYGRSKLADLLFAYELADRLTGTQTLSVAAHPGAVPSNILPGVPAVAKAVGSRVMPGADVGCLSTLRAATDLSAVSGDYFGPYNFIGLTGRPKLVKSSKLSHDKKLQDALWRASEQLCGLHYQI